jgi:hypothetical protein
MKGYIRRTVLAGLGVSLAGCTSAGDSEPEEPTDQEEQSPDLEPVFNSAAENADQAITIENVDDFSDGVFVDYWSFAETMDERAEEMGTVCGIYAGVVHEEGEDVPPMVAFGVDPETSEQLYSFTVERKWAEQWLAEEIDGNEVVQRASDTYEEYVPPAE